MPFTPFHFGPHGCVGLPCYRYLNVFMFMGANIAIDMEPLLVLVFDLNYPLHGYCHTILFGSLVGLVFASLSYPFRHGIENTMRQLRLAASPRYKTMVLSAISGAWFHILFDAIIYTDIRPLFPFQTNPVYGILSEKAVYLISSACFFPAIVIYLSIVVLKKNS